MDYKKWEYKLIPLVSLSVSSRNIRKTRIDSQLDSLKENIRKNGLFDAIYVLRGTNGKYEVIKSQRRMLSFQKLAQMEPGKYDSIPAIVVDYNPEEAGLASVTEDRLKQGVGEEDYAVVVTELAKTKGKDEIQRLCGFSDIEEVNYYLGRAIRTSPETIEKRKEPETPKKAEVEFMPQKIEEGKPLNPFAGMYSTDIGIINSIVAKTKEPEDAVLRREKSYLSNCIETTIKIDKETMDRFSLLAMKTGSGSSYYELFEFIRKYAPKYLDENHILK